MNGFLFKLGKRYCSLLADPVDDGGVGGGGGGGISGDSSTNTTGTISVTVPGTTMAWDVTKNPGMPYGKNDGTKAILYPRALIVGQQLVISVTGQIKPSDSRPYGGPAGNSTLTPTPDQGSTGTFFPTKYVTVGHTLGLCGAMAFFTDENDVVIGAPIEIGTGKTIVVPVGAKRLYFAINDDHYSDNVGSFVYTISGGTQPGLSRSSNHVICKLKTGQTHNLKIGDAVTVIGADDLTFNGTFTIDTVYDSTSFGWPQGGPDAFSGNGHVVTSVPGAVNNQYQGNALNGQVVYFQGATGVIARTILSSDAVFGDANKIAELTLSSPVGEVITAQPFLIAPRRATHWHLYASESEGSKIGFYLAAIPVTAFSYIDESPWLGDPNSLFQKIERPFRNDPTPPSRIAEIHKYRIFRRDDRTPNFFTFTANEEVAALLNGAESECIPGADRNTLSDIIDEQSVPDTTTRIRGLKSHADALYIGTEKEIIPLLGESIDDFSFSEVTSIKVGLAGRFSWCSTHHGLAFMSYDRKLYLFPLLMQPVSYMNLEEQLVEIGRPKRNTFFNVNPAFLDTVQFTHYHHGERDWLVVSFQNKQLAYETWVFDFDTKGWFTLQQGYVCTEVFEPYPGQKVLVGGTQDGNVYVVDDQDFLYPPADTAKYPDASFRPALVDFGNPDFNHVFKYVEYEVTNEDLPVRVTFWLDPKDVDNPGDGQEIIMQPVIGSNRYRGFPEGGTVCHRLLVEFAIDSSQDAGAIRGVKLAAEPIDDVLLGDPGATGSGS